MSDSTLTTDEAAPVFIDLANIHDPEVQRTIKALAGRVPQIESPATPTALTAETGTTGRGRARNAPTGLRGADHRGTNMARAGADPRLTTKLLITDEARRSGGTLLL